MKKYFNNFKTTYIERKKIIKTYKNGDVCSFFSPVLKQAELTFAKTIGMPYALATPNCTAALLIAYKVLEIKEDEHILIPNYTHPATAMAAISANVKYKLFDCMPNSYNANLSEISRLINDKTRAIVFVHLKGLKQNIEEVSNFCKKKNIILIEDVAQGFGVKFENGYAGSFGEISCFSFNDSKSLPLGEGGMCLFKDVKHEKFARIITHEGEFVKSSGISSTIANGSLFSIIDDKFQYAQYGFNFRAFPPIFSILTNKLKTVEKRRKRKFLLCNLYAKYLDTNLFMLMSFDHDCFPLYLPVLVKDKQTVKNLLSNCYNSGNPIGSMHYPILSDIEVFKNNASKPILNMKNSRNLYEKLIFLPLSENIRVQHTKKISLYLNRVGQFGYNNALNNEEEIKNFDGLFIW